MENTKTVVKTVKQYNKYPVPSEEMAVLQEIAEKYRKVKNYVYSRYGSSKYISELSNGYKLSREINNTGIRQQIDIPSKYFEKAKFDAFADMKMNWSNVKNKIRKLSMSNKNFTADDKHYINFILKNDRNLQAVINRDEIALKEAAGKHYDSAISIGNLSNIQIISKEWLMSERLNINQLFNQTDALISDYSSGAVDYMLADKPMAFTLDDVEEYEASRGFVFDNICEWLPGKEIRNYDDMCEFIDMVAAGEDYDREKRRSLRAKMHKYNDGNSCRRIVEALGIER